MVEEGQIYRHFKGNKYKIICIAKSVDDLRDLVVYKDINCDKIWVRDYTEFISLVDRKRYPNVKQINRFERVI